MQYLPWRERHSRLRVPDGVTLGRFTKGCLGEITFDPSPKKLAAYANQNNHNLINITNLTNLTRGTARNARPGTTSVDTRGSRVGHFCVRPLGTRTV
jgi:hypothetical protein